MTLNIRLATSSEVLPLRTRLRQESNGQIVHDSIHRRDGWTRSYLIEENGISLGFASVAIAGPWTDRPTLFEFYLTPPYRGRAFALFEQLLAVSGPRFFEIQSNDELTTALVLTYGCDLATEKIVFADRLITHLSAPGGTNLRCLTPPGEIRQCMQQCQGGGEWQLEWNGTPIGKGGLLFHYNPPYGDVYMEVEEAFRRRGFGAYLVQEIKRAAYEFGAIPAARCSPNNSASRRTLQKAGFVPCGHILIGSMARERIEHPSPQEPAP